MRVPEPHGLTELCPFIAFISVSNYTFADSLGTRKVINNYLLTECHISISLIFSLMLIKKFLNLRRFLQCLNATNSWVTVKTCIARGIRRKCKRFNFCNTAALNK